jgi:plasmid stabilization system protein ParE
MARKVTWTEVAWSDLEEVADYIAKDSFSVLCSDICS